MVVEKYEIRFFAVGTTKKGGDAIFIRLYDKESNVKVILIDGGYQDTAERIINYMKSLGLDTINLMINTHPDLDHISGLVTIMNSPEIKVEKLMYNRPWRDNNIKAALFSDSRITDKSLNKRLTQCFKKAYELEQAAFHKSEISGKGCNIIHPQVGNSYYDCLYVLGPTAEHYRNNLLASDKVPTNDYNIENQPYLPKKLNWKKYIRFFVEWFNNEETSAINETSMVLFLQLPDKNFLFTGDVGKGGLTQAINYLYHTGPIIDFRITHLQLPHHGSRKNINPEIIEEINCNNFIISCPPGGEEFGHPSARLVNKILEIRPKAQIFKTAGTIFIYHSSNLHINARVATPLGAYEEIED